jgi:hypothetical protein
VRRHFSGWGGVTVWRDSGSTFGKGRSQPMSAKAQISATWRAGSARKSR